MWHVHLKKAFQADFCDEIVQKAKARGFERAAVNNYGTQKVMENIRNNERLEFDDEELATKLQAQLQIVLGDSFPYVFEERSFVKAGDHFRVYRYVPGQYFKPHKDGSFQLGELESEITALLYLNDAVGGETVLYPYGYSQTWKNVTVAPEKGDVLLFNHSVWHEGKEVREGEKLVLRTDLFYRGQ